MTIPTREEALETLNMIAPFFTGIGGQQWIATLRSYIESHTGEPVAWQYLLENGRWSNMPGDWTPDEDALGRYTYRPLFASPVQPVKLEWIDNPHNDFSRHQEFLQYRGQRIGVIEDRFNGEWHAYFMNYDRLAFPPVSSRDHAQTALESTARQWLSGGDE